MTGRARTAVTGAAAVTFLAWSAVQLWLTHRLAVDVHHQMVVNRQAFLARFPSGLASPVPPASAREWVLPALAGILTVLALAIVAGALARGGRGRWALIVAVVPAANVWRGWEDGRPLGFGWTQMSDRHLTAWTLTGTAVDTALLLALAFAAIAVVGRPGARARVDVMRAVPPALVLIGWWAVRNPMPDQVHQIWLVQALAWVLAVALLARCDLPPAVRAGVVLLVLPFGAVGTTLSALAGDAGTRWLHHDLFALAVVAYVAGVPALVGRVRARRPAAPALPA